MKNLECFGERLRSHRLRRGWSQEDLAGKLDVSNGSVGNWEIGPTIPRPIVLSKIAALFEISISELLGDEPPTSLKDKPAGTRSESSPHSWVEVSTLEKTLADLANRLSKAEPKDRKFILSNIRDALDELEDRELNSSVVAGTVRLLKKAMDSEQTSDPK